MKVMQMLTIAALSAAGMSCSSNYHPVTHRESITSQELRSMMDLSEKYREISLRPISEEEIKFIKNYDPQNANDSEREIIENLFRINPRGKKPQELREKWCMLDSGEKRTFYSVLKQKQ